MSSLELIDILNHLSSSARQTVLFLELKNLNTSFNPVATWHVMCVPNLTFAYVMHPLLVNMFAYNHDKLLLDTNLFP